MATDLTDRKINALRRKPAPAGKTYDVMDGEVRGFGVRVNERGVLTFFLNARFGGSRTTARRAIGRYGEMTLERARKTAREWKQLARQGADPQEEEARKLQEQARRRKNTFAGVAEDFIAAMSPTERKRAEVARDIRRELAGPLGARPVADIRARDLIEIANTIKGRGAPHQARNVLGYARRVFSWAVAQDAYGIDSSPCATIRPDKIVGPKARRKRILDDDELRALWRAGARMPYPYGPVFRLLMLTAARKSEIAEARWSEVDMTRRALIVAPERQKSAEAHAIPLCDEALAILAALPRFAGGDFIFSTTGGVKPINGFSKTKERVDRRVSRTWRALGRRAGTDRRKAAVQPWVIHDIRRTVRTHLSALPIPQHIAERIIGHAQGDLIRTYDLWSHLEEKREGLRLWQERLRSILTPANSAPDVGDAGGNVILWKKAAVTT